MIAGLLVYRAGRAGHGEQALAAVGEGVLRSGGQADDGLVDLIGLEDRNSIALFILPGHGALVLRTIADSRHRGLALLGSGHAVDAEVVHLLLVGQGAELQRDCVAHRRGAHRRASVHILHADRAQTVAAGHAGEVHHGLVVDAGAEGSVVRQAGRPGDGGVTVQFSNWFAIGAHQGFAIRFCHSNPFHCEYRALTYFGCNPIR